MSERLQLKKEEPAREEMSCPGCGKPLGVGAIICVQCGYDTRTGRRVDASGGRKVSPVLIIGLVLIIVAAGAVVYLRSLDDGISPTPPPAPVAAAPESPSQEPPPASPESAPAPVAETAPTETAPPVDGTTASELIAVTETNAAEQAPEPAPEINWEEVAAQQRNRIQLELDRRTPMFQVDESVELRLANGFIRRGIFRGASGGEIQLEEEGQGIQKIAFGQLDRNTRLRVDDDYRERYVDFLTRQRIAEMRRAQAAQP